MSHPSIVIVGHVCIDHNKSEHASYTGWGSSALYMAQVFEREYGVTPQIITTYGPDIAPYLPPGTVLLPGEPGVHATLVYENDSSSGKRIQYCHNTEAAGPPALNAPAKTALGQADIIVVAPLLPNYSATYIARLLHCAKPGSLCVLCPQGYFRHIGQDGLVTPQPFADAEQIVPLFDVVLYSEEDTSAAFVLAERWTSSACRTNIVVTQSAAGATIVNKSGRITVPTTPIAPEAIIDSVGCGDTFAAAVCYQYFMQKSLEKAVRNAHLVAARKLLAVTAR